MGSEEVEKENNSKSGLCKTIARGLFSHMGLCLIVIVYCIIGGVLFEMLEKDNEINACIEAREEYTDMENETLFSLLDVVLSNPLGSHAADVQMLGVFESFRNNTFSIGYEGSWCEGYGTTNGPMHEWNFAGGIFFSMTIITTIGYGHIAPKTQWGRILCLPYALMGIPLMLMFLANVGDVLANVFKYVYAKIICCGCLKAKKKRTAAGKETGRTESADSSTLSLTKNNASTNSISENARRGSSGSNTTSNSLTPTNISQLPGSNQTHPTDMSMFTSAGSEMKQRNAGANPLNIKALGSTDLAERGRKMRLSSTNSKEPLILDDDSDDEDDEEEWEEINKIAVPLTVSLAIIGLYIIGGAVLFKYWEGWDMLQSSYFCFITLSTIGFGDVTPGRDFSDPNANARLIIGSIYSIFGMAILSMCFTLMQEEMLIKFQWIGKKMGVVDKEEEEFDELVKNDQNQNGRNSSEC